jgi:poly(3-hydroxyalkanoate) synthetase
MRHQVAIRRRRRRKGADGGENRIRSCATRLFLNNDLAEGRFEVDGKPVSLRDIHVPLFAVSTIADHVAPWRSVYKI